MSNLLLIDLSHLFWTYYHSTADQEVSAAYDATIAKVVKLREGFDHVVICCDSKPYKRNELLQTYKANRVGAPPQASEQFERCKARLAADGLLILAHPGAEADDVIASVVRALEGQKVAVTIASNDKDLLQLVDDMADVRVLAPMTGNVYRVEQVIEKFGVNPTNMVDLLALMGDKSDNIPGVPGIGQVNAAKLLTHCSLAEALELPISELERYLPAKLAGNLLTHAKTVEIAQRLIRLDDTIPVDVEALFKPGEVKALTPKGEFDDAVFEPVAPEAPKVEAPPKTVALATRPQEWGLALEPADPRAAYTVAKYFYESRLYPQFGSQAAIFTVILRGRALGLDAATACSMFHQVENRLTMHAELIIGLVLRSGKAEYFKCIETTDTKATWVSKRQGDGSELSISWDLDRAVRAGLMQKNGERYGGISRSGRSSNWDKYPRTMLRWRAGTELAHACYPEVVTGLVSPEEVEELEES